MNPNVENVFSYNQITLDQSRSGFDLSHDVLTTWKNGDLIPIGEPVEVLAGDTFDVNINAIIRMTTPIFPVMGNAYFDFYAFFVPGRLVWDHWEEFHGANKLTAWEPTTEYTIPLINAPSGGWTEGTIADYFGIPTKVGDIAVNALPFRAYTLIWNEWFRDETRKDRSMIHKDEVTRTGVNTGTYTTDAELGGLPLKVARFHDLFTTTLRRPQRGPDVFIPLGGLSGIAPVTTKSGRDYQINVNKALTWVATGNSPVTPLDDSKKYKVETAHASVYGTGIQSTYGSVSTDTLTSSTIGPSNLWANLRNANASYNSTINELREAFAIQRYYEAMARAGGGRFTEIIYRMFGVKSPDARLQRPEYIGAVRQPINIQAVLQTSSTDSVSPQGNVAANSMSVIANEHIGTYSATEPGYLIFLGACRTDHSYQQGLSQVWNRRTKFDIYWPQLANIGETAVLNKRIYAQGSSVVDTDGNIVDEQVFGYQEAWAEYRYLNNTVHGDFRSNATGSLDSWHYADYYTALPIGVSDSWIDEPYTNVARTLAVQTGPQFIGDFYFDMKAYRPMPVESIPGLIDHH